MVQHIDVSSVLRRTVCDLYSNLVTRPTGAAVRAEIEALVAERPAGARTLTVIDFTHVGLLDYSCADEVVAKLLLRYSTPDAPHDAYFVLRGTHEAHVDAIETVLARYGLALVLEDSERHARLVGAVGDDERRVWDAVYRVGPADVTTVTAVLANEQAARWEPDGVGRVMDELFARRVVIAVGTRYLAVGRTEVAVG
mgnify:CR=1 FL=1